ncbi:MAG: GNAT family protein [Devosia sp.]
MTELYGDRVRLVPTTLAHLDLEDISGDDLARELAAAAPPSWPPLYNDAQTRYWLRVGLRGNPLNATWYGYYVIAMIDGIAVLAGTAGFKGPADALGMVEIGYSIVPELHRRGIASAAVALICRYAFASGVTAVTAQTLPSLLASQGVLAKASFRHVETVIDPEEGEVWTYQLERP